jgi:hypothetical protein
VANLASVLLPKDKKISAVGLLVSPPLAAIGFACNFPYSQIVVVFFLLSAIFFIVNAMVLRIPFFPYDRILSAVSDSSGLVWKKEPGVRVDVGGIHDSIQVYLPRVVACGDGWRMYYRAGGKKSFIASAFSTDGLDWREEPGVRIGAHGDNRVERIEGCDVAYIAGEWKMYYSAFDGRMWSIYQSRSHDGLEWSPGAICVEASAGELPHVMAPSLLQLDGEFWLYVMNFSAEKVRICASRSIDGKKWPPLSECFGCSAEGLIVRSPCVRQIGDGQLRMYLSVRNQAHSPVGSRIVSATSHDGLIWREEEGERIDAGSGLDRHGAAFADLVARRDGWRMYYTGYWGRHWFEPITLLRYGIRVLMAAK